MEKTESQIAMPIEKSDGEELKSLEQRCLALDRMYQNVMLASPETMLKALIGDDDIEENSEVFLTICRGYVRQRSNCPIGELIDYAELGAFVEYHIENRIREIATQKAEKEVFRQSEKSYQ
jgi:hypothetical protein